MSSISATGSGARLPSLQLLQDETLKDDKSRGTDAAQQGERSSALGDAASTPKSERADGASDSLHPQDDLLSKINSLISNELSSGKLSSDRAAVLRDVFSNAFAGEPNQTTASNSGTQPAAAESGSTGTTTPAAADGTAASQASAADSTQAGSASHDVGIVLNDFLKLLQAAKSTASTYGASGSSSTETTASGSRLINYHV